jgi:hypothetical protein
MPIKQSPSILAARRKQLLGCWRSDAKRTVAELIERRIKPKRKMQTKGFKTFQKIFGKLQLTYRPSTIVSEFPGRSRQTGKYVILGADADSIAIMTDQKLPFGLGGSKITHIHFEKDYYWISLGGGMREFFKRVTKAPRIQKSPLTKAATVRKCFP